MDTNMIRTASEKLRKINVCHSGNIYTWIEKVTALINEGADPRVLDSYFEGNSIITEYLLAGRDKDSLYTVVKYLLAIGVTPTNEVFINCMMNNIELAELVMVASNNTIDVNILDIYGMHVHTWVVKELVSNRRKTSLITYLISKGLRTDAISFSIDNILALTR